jgi:anti-sigma regulatory factor (Ser/Thr protein kinase)
MTVIHGADFRHEALFYAGEQGFLTGTVPFVLEAVGAGAPILVAVRQVRARALRAALGAASDRVLFADMEELGRNPARIIPAWRDFVEQSLDDGGSVRGVGEPIWDGRGPAEVLECQHHESLLNLAFADTRSFWLLCPYDTDALERDVLEAARCSHPFVAERDASYESDAYVDPATTDGPFAGELSPPPSATDEITFTCAELPTVRAFVAEQAEGSGLNADRAQDLVLAVSELATNSVLHAGGQGTVRVWRQHRELVCEVRDGGRLVQPLIGRERPRPEQASGRGLWLVNQLCDLVQMRSSPKGSAVRLHMRFS